MLRVSKLSRFLRTSRSHCRLSGVGGLVDFITGTITRKPALRQIRYQDLIFPFFLRIPSSDIHVFKQIFFNNAYRCKLTRPPRIIVDAGANIGLASIYFANKFPDSRIIAIEPEENNYQILKRNVEKYANVIPVCAALWYVDTIIEVVDVGTGEWGYVTRTHGEIDKKSIGVRNNTRAITVNTLMKEHSIEHIDILKMDIEGAECEVFREPSSWIEKVDCLIVELHERIKPGCNRSFDNVRGGFDNEWSQGENIYLTRNGASLIRDNSPICRKT
jgi:FkbM family methyltransferase